MKDDFFKFPSTPHLATLNDVDIRGDKVMSDSERNEFLQYNLFVEEKVDGANLGISYDADGNIRAQNRGAYLHLPGAGQWKKLREWLTPRTDTLFEHLSEHYILFGEWCYAQHSVFYDRLPDWFLGFDIYDKRVGRFLSVSRRDEFFNKMNIAQVPTIGRGRFALADLKRLLCKSAFSDQPAEGLYLRFDKKQMACATGKTASSGVFTISGKALVPLCHQAKPVELGGVIRMWRRALRIWPRYIEKAQVNNNDGQQYGGVIIFFPLPDHGLGIGAGECDGIYFSYTDVPRLFSMGIFKHK